MRVLNPKRKIYERYNESGLDYFLVRYYSSAQGRFTSPDEFTGGPDELYSFAEHAYNPTFYADIVDPQSLNKYQYCLNNPLAYVDPDGHQITRALERAAQTPAGQKMLLRAAQAGTAVTSVVSGAAEAFWNWASKNNTSGDASQPTASRYVENYVNRKQAEYDAQQQTGAQDRGGETAGPGGADKKPIFGEKGTQTTSTTVYRGTGKERIDVENPNPGQRAGQIHYQDHKGNKYLYDPAKKEFTGASRSLNKKLISDRGIRKG